MRANEFLVEVEMTPNALRREASKINAKAGMEFEMYVPGASGPDEDAESEADYGEDERAVDIDDIIQFFSASDVNSRRDVARLREELTEAYDEYVMNEQDEQWYEEGKALLREYIEENDWDEDAEIENAMNAMDLSAAEKEEACEAGRSVVGIMTSKELPKTPAYGHWSRAVDIAEGVLEDKVNDEWESQGRTYEKVKDDWFEDQESPDQRDWLRSEGYHHMSDIENHFDITWPHWTTPDSGGDIDIETVGTMFSQAIGKEVMTGGYHRAGRSDTAYSLEPDGSLAEPNDSQDGGLEFISPPMSISDLIDDLKKVKAWADKTGCYTNESTGLHINVSVPQGAHRDYVKLALLLGDDYILEKFGREANTFCKSSLAQVKQYANNEANARAVLEKMRTRLDSMASRAIHTGETNKYVSINNKGDYVEFRSPGGDWLGDNFDQIENTLLRTVVALDASSDPMKYRKEYLKKLYKILAPKGDGDPMAIFAKYAAGEFKEMPKETLKFLLKQIQSKRAAGKAQQTNTTQAISNMVARARLPMWDVSRADIPHEYQARGRTPAEARLDVRRAYPAIFPDSVSNDQIIVRASPERVNQPPTDTSDRLFLWTMYDINTDQPVGTPFRAITSGDAGQLAIEQMDGYGMPLDRRGNIGVRRVRATDQDPVQTPGPEETPAPQGATRRMWSVIDRNSGEHLTSFEADNHADALLQGTQWCNDNDIAQATRRNLIVDTTE